MYGISYITPSLSRTEICFMELNKHSSNSHFLFNQKGVSSSIYNIALERVGPTSAWRGEIIILSEQCKIHGATK